MRIEEVADDGISIGRQEERSNNSPEMAETTEEMTEEESTEAETEPEEAESEDTEPEPELEPCWSGRLMAEAKTPPEPD